MQKCICICIQCKKWFLPPSYSPSSFLASHWLHVDTHLPQSFFLFPGGRHHPGVELDVRIKVVFPRYWLQILLDLLGGRHKSWPLRVGAEGELIQRGPHVARGPGVGVMVPRAPHITAWKRDLDNFRENRKEGEIGERKWWIHFTAFFSCVC